MITAQDVAKLREKTGAGVLACQKALEEAGGDFAKASQILGRNASTIAEKKAERATEHGLIEAYVHLGKVGVLIEIACESDFVAKNADFKELAHNLAMQIASMKPKTIEELLTQVYIKDEAQTIKNYISGATAKIGENIQVKRFTRYELDKQ